MLAAGDDGVVGEAMCVPAVAWRSIGMLGDSLQAPGAQVHGVGRLCARCAACDRPNDAPLPPQKQPKRNLLLFSWLRSFGTNSEHNDIIIICVGCCSPRAFM